MTPEQRIEFTVPDVPIAQPRQRVTVTAGKPRTYTPTKHPVNAFKAAVKMAASAAHDGAPLLGPVSLTICFVLPRPGGKYWKTKPMPRYWHIKRPDSDNLEKAVMDALTKLVWHDDSQVCEKHSTKVVASGGEPPHVEIVIVALR